MKILKLEIEGFRSLANVVWEPSDLNVLIGPNASGKSNVLRLLEMLSASATGRLSKYVQSEGGIEPIVWDGRTDAITIRMKTSPIDPIRTSRDDLTYQVVMERLGRTSVYRVNYELLGNFYYVEKGAKDQPFKFLERDYRHAIVFDKEERQLVAPPESVPEDETLLSAAAGPFVANDVAPRFQKQVASWRIHHDLNTQRGAAIRQPSVARAETVVDQDGQNLINVLHTLYTGSRDFKHEVDSAMKAAFGEEYEELVFPPAADQRIQLRLRWKSLQREQSAADLSDGTLRFLFLLAVFANPTPPSLLAIDEPELGLHPSMLPIVAEYARDAATRTQVVLTTHSPSFLDAFGSNAPNTTVVDWKDGKTSLRVRTGEDLSYWLKEYTLGELYRSGELEAVE